MQLVKQIRYFGDGNTEGWNYPTNITANDLINGSVFENLAAAKIRI
jgi:hypothetical protein